MNDDLEWEPIGKTKPKRGVDPRGRRFLIALLGVGSVLTTIAFQWGNYLVGIEYAIGYSGITILIMWLLARPLVLTEQPSYACAAVISILALPIAYAMAFPTSVNSDVHILIEKQAIARSARKELYSLFASDPAFVDLSVSTSTYGKGVDITIRGSLDARTDFYRLRTRIDRGCKEVYLPSIDWNVRLRSPVQRIAGLDYILFPSQR